MTEQTNEPIIRLKGIEFTYPGAGKATLDGLDLEVFEGDNIGIIAPNGSGKTTLFHAIMGLCRPGSGSIEIFGRPMKKEADFAGVRLKLGLLFQDSDDQLFSPTVLDDVAFGPLNQGLSQEDALAVARGALASLGLEKFENCITHKLSGGQKRLAALASVLAMKPKVLLLDEPTAGLDPTVKKMLVTILNRLNISSLVISHDYDFLLDVTNHLLSMEDGKIIHGDQLHIHRHEHIHKHGRQPHKHV